MTESKEIEKLTKELVSNDKVGYILFNALYYEFIKIDEAEEAAKILNLYDSEDSFFYKNQSLKKGKSELVNNLLNASQI